MAEKRLYQTIAGEIRALIDSGEFPAGSRLPGERELAQRFRVSRVTIREAEIALETEGAIVIKTGSGVYVQPRPANRPGALPDVTAFDLTAARLIIEAESAALAAAHVTESDLRELEASIEAMSGTATNESAEEADRQFHLTIARLSGNPVIAYVVETLWRMRTELPRVKRVYGSVCSGDASARHNEHSAILEALRRKNPAAARKAMREHFSRLFDAMLDATENEALEEIKRKTSESRARFLVATRV